VELDDRLLHELTTWTPDPATAPRSLDLMVLVSAPSPAAIDDGDFRLVVAPNPGAEAAGRALGRFADLLGDPGRAALRRAVAADAALAPGRMLVEVVHAPQRWRSANVAVRPAVHGHEVVIGVPPGVPEQQVVPVDELVVGTRGPHLVVRWPAAGTDVVAVQSHMLNRALAPPAARLLLDLATDGRCTFAGFDWGPLAAAYPVLPRVQRGRVVLAPARWWLQAPDADDRPDGWLDDWCTRWGVPRHVYLSTGDHRLLLDLDDPRHREIVLDELRRVGAVQLQEAMPGLESAWLPGPDGPRVAELVVPLVLREPAPAEGHPVPDREPGSGAVAAADRLRLPGSDWLYLKLYGPAAFQDDLVTGPLPDLARSVTDAGLADRWFFVRYADPDPHLRVRFHGDPRQLMGPLLRVACAWAGQLVADGTCSRFAVDTYEREVERYGGPAAIDDAETVFCADSTVVATLLRLVRADALSSDPVTLAVVSVDDLLEGLGLDRAQRTRLYTEAAPLTREGGEEYRRRKAELRPLLGAPHPADAAGLGAVLAPRRAASLRVDSPRVARNHVHMHLNRLLTDGVAEQTVLELLRRTRAGLDRSTAT
jgi:thiopeptide-type bacteriocin biosynthesis protein